MKAGSQTAHQSTGSVAGLWNFEKECAAAIGIVAHADRAAMGLHDCLADCQPNAFTVMLGLILRLNLSKSFKDPLLFVLWHTASLVFHSELNAGIRFLIFNCHFGVV